MSSSAPPDTFDSDAIVRQADALFRQGRIHEAEALCRRVIARHAQHADALILLGHIAYQQRKPDLLNALGLAILNLQRWPDALDALDRALTLNPKHAEALNNRAYALQQLGRFDDAAASFTAALTLRPNDADILKNRGLLLLEMRRYGDALTDFEAAVAARPAFAEAWNERGNALQKLNRISEALQSFDHAVALNPRYAAAHSHRGGALMRLRRMDDALAAYSTAQTIEPTFAKAHLNEGLCRLLMGDYDRGWPKYEYRWQCEPLNALRKHFDVPLWLGQSDISGKTILLHAEQGAGDVIQFCRYAPLLAARGARVVLHVPAALKSLLESLNGVSSLVSDGDHLPAFDLPAFDLPAFDLHCPLMSLPLALKTTLADIPAQIPYLHAPADKVAAWASRLGPRHQKRIGLVWSGDPRHGEDHNRSIELRRFAPLFNTRADFISLQKEPRADDLAWLRQDGRIRHFGAELTDFAETAALISHMDIVVTVDTSVAHLAAALGRQTWILLSHVGVDWRWLLTREDSPWYPTARLYRQPVIDDWQSVIARVSADAAALVADKV